MDDTSDSDMSTIIEISVITESNIVFQKELNPKKIRVTEIEGVSRNNPEATQELEEPLALEKIEECTTL
jgi:hypothetical protein